MVELLSLRGLFIVTQWVELNGKCLLGAPFRSLLPPWLARVKPIAHVSGQRRASRGVVDTTQRFYICAGIGGEPKRYTVHERALFTKKQGVSTASNSSVRRRRREAGGEKNRGATSGLSERKKPGRVAMFTYFAEDGTVRWGGRRGSEGGRANGQDRYPKDATPAQFRVRLRLRNPEGRFPKD